MNYGRLSKSSFLGVLIAACLFLASVAFAAETTASPSLAGTWVLVAADVQHPDGTRTRDYGASPKGLLMIDRQGNYSLQIFKSERTPFASSDKGAASPDEYKAAVMGSSTHFGSVSVDPANSILTFHIKGASFPNWEGQEQRRTYELQGDELSYRVPPRPNGDVPVSVWHRVN